MTFFCFKTHEMENKAFSFKDFLQIIGFIVTFVGAYYALKNEIQQSQIKTEASLKELQMIQSNDVKILELKMNSLQLQVAKLEAELKSAK